MNKLAAFVLLLSLISFNGFSQSLELKQFISENAELIDIRDTTQFEDLKFLKAQLRDKRVVMLGEFNHGSREINEVKFRLIRYLHDSLGFNVLLIESGIGEVHTINHDRSIADHATLRYRLTGPWHSDIFSVLTGYLQSRPDLLVGGIDPQRSGSSFSRLITRIISPLDTNLARQCQNLEKVNHQFKDDMKNAPGTTAVLARRDSIIRSYRELAARLNDEGRLSSFDRAVIAKTIENRIAYLDYYSIYSSNYPKRFVARDSLMAQNALWYINTLFPNEKVMITAHNYHIARSHPNTFVMGNALAEELENDAYVIGIFGGQGTYANNSRKPKPLDPPKGDTDLTAFIAHGAAPCFFMHIGTRDASSSSWFHTPVRAQTFIDLSGSAELILSDWFDGLLFVKEVTPSIYH